MHSFRHHHHSEPGEASARATNGLIVNFGWRYDLLGWFHDTFMFRGKLRELRQMTVNLARVQPGEQVLDVGCGTGTLLRKAAERFDGAEMVGVDPESGMVEAAGEAWLGDRPVRFVLASAERPPF